MNNVWGVIEGLIGRFSSLSLETGLKTGPESSRRNLSNGKVVNFNAQSRHWFDGIEKRGLLLDLGSFSIIGFAPVPPRETALTRAAAPRISREYTRERQTPKRKSETCCKLASRMKRSSPRRNPGTEPHIVAPGYATSSRNHSPHACSARLSFTSDRTSSAFSRAHRLAPLQ